MCVIKGNVTFEPIMQFGCLLRFIEKKNLFMTKDYYSNPLTQTEIATTRLSWPWVDWVENIHKP